MEFAIQAGVKVDLATPAEVKQIVGDALTGWRAEIARGTRYRHPAAQGAADGTGLLSIPAEKSIGPAEGFVWSITRITVTGLTAAQVLNAYINDATPLLAVYTFTATVNTATFGQRGLILNGGDRLVLAGTGLTAAGIYTAACEVTELPQQLGSRFL